jgi:thioredoxin 1
MGSELVSDVGDATFQKEVLEASQAVLVDFWATWCGPCKAMNPVLQEMAKTYQGKLKIVKVNIENDQQTPQRYGVTALPTLLFFKGGTVAHSIVGAPSKSKLDEAIKRVIA